MHKFSLLNPHPVAPAVAPAVIKAAAAVSPKPPSIEPSCIGMGFLDPFGGPNELVDANYDKTIPANVSPSGPYTAGTGATIMGQDANNNKCPGLVLSCIDFRSHDDVLRDLTTGQIFYTVPRSTNPKGNKQVVFGDPNSMPPWLTKEDAALFNNVSNKYDEFILAGSSLGYNTALNFDPSGVYSSATFKGNPATDSSFNSWQIAFTQHLDIAILLHDVSNIILIDHLECGAYKTFYSQQYAVEGRTKGKDLWVPPHLINMDRTQSKIKYYYDKLYRNYKYTNMSEVRLKVNWVLLIGGFSIASFELPNTNLTTFTSGVPNDLLSLLTVSNLQSLVKPSNDAFGANLRISANVPANAITLDPIPDNIGVTLPFAPNIEIVFSLNTSYEFNSGKDSYVTIRRKPLNFYYFIMDTDGSLVSYNSEPINTTQESDRFSKPTYGSI
jgi:hypothetical protein